MSIRWHPVLRLEPGRQNGLRMLCGEISIKPLLVAQRTYTIERRGRDTLHHAAHHPERMALRTAASFIQRLGLMQENQRNRRKKKKTKNQHPHKTAHRLVSHHAYHQDGDENQYTFFTCPQVFQHAPSPSSASIPASIAAAFRPPRANLRILQGPFFLRRRWLRQRT